MECYAFVICTLTQTWYAQRCCAWYSLLCKEWYVCLADVMDVGRWLAPAVICLPALHIIHYSSFIIHSSGLPRLDSFRHSLRSCHLPQEGGYLGFVRYVSCRRCDKMLKTRFTRKCRCVDLATRCEENTHLMRQKVNEMRQNRCKDAKIWRIRCEETAHNKIDII